MYFVLDIYVVGVATTWYIFAKKGPFLSRKLACLCFLPYYKKGDIHMHVHTVSIFQTGLRSIFHVIMKGYIILYYSSYLGSTPRSVSQVLGPFLSLDTPSSLA